MLPVFQALYMNPVLRGIPFDLPRLGHSPCECALISLRNKLWRKSCVQYNARSVLASRLQYYAFYIRLGLYYWSYIIPEFWLVAGVLNLQGGKRLANRYFYFCPLHESHTGKISSKKHACEKIRCIDTYFFNFWPVCQVHTFRFVIFSNCAVYSLRDERHHGSRKKCNTLQHVT